MKSKTPSYAGQTCGFKRLALVRFSGTAGMLAALAMLVAMESPSTMPGTTEPSTRMASDEPTTRTAITKVYFTDDDGQTYFADDSSKVAPFDHNGKLAVRCYVYSCGGTKFVGYLEKFTDAARSKLEAARKSNQPNPMMIEDMQMMQSRLVKKPGDAKWIKTSDFQKAQKVMEIHCPDGSNGDLVPVLP